MENIISHLFQDPSDGHWVIQTNDAHTDGVKHLASQFADEFGMSCWGEIIGSLHDKGKESKAFQEHIKKQSGYEPNIIVSGNYRHAYIGGIISRKLYGNSFDCFITNPIISHHSGLHDYDELDISLNKEIPQEIDIHNVTRIQPQKPPFNLSNQDFHHVARMLFSCLVDADYLDTERFMNRSSFLLRKKKATLTDLLPKLEQHISLLNHSHDTKINRIRHRIQQLCIDSAKSQIGFYSLTVPTGGGKTISSLIWAIKHAIHNGQKRIIIAIPYTSIIVQTASVLKSIFGEENILEHHSNVDPSKITDEQLRERLNLASENWDYPIIVTTNVQLFESMFSNKPSVCRKLHNIVNSVIIYDEIQTIPTDFLQPIVDAINSYNKLFHVSVLFTTASQPILSGLIQGCNPNASFIGLDNVTEIIPKELELHKQLERVKLSIDDTPKDYGDIANSLIQHKQVLCIVNTRKDAKEIFDRLPKEGVTLHLSKMMCPTHISETINKIISALSSTSDQIVRVISTQLIEAGVDIDFPVVYRQESGLDSILQAAGRCNREGKTKLSTTYVFSLTKERSLPKGHIQDANNARLSLDATSDWFAPSTMTEYFRQLYSRKECFDKKHIKSYLYHPGEGILFSSASTNFHLIDDDGISVFVNWKDCINLVYELKKSGPSYILMKKLSKYRVSLHQADFNTLYKAGVIQEIFDKIYFLSYKEQYNEYTGVQTYNNLTNSFFMI